MATGGSDGSLPARRAKMLPSRSISTLQPAACAQSTNRSRISLSSADKASRRRPTSRKRPISAERSSVSHSRLGLISRTLGAGIRLAPLVLIDDVLQRGALHRAELAHRVADGKDRVGVHAFGQAERLIDFLLEKHVPVGQRRAQPDRAARQYHVLNRRVDRGAGAGTGIGAILEAGDD